MKRRQNEDERWAEKWLRKQGYKDIQRPCSDPPDFLVNSHCAVEVTRLNQRITVGDDKFSKGEEEARKPLTRSVEKAIAELGPPGNDGKSWTAESALISWNSPMILQNSFFRMSRTEKA